MTVEVGMDGTVRVPSPTFRATFAGTAVRGTAAGTAERTAPAAVGVGPLGVVAAPVTTYEIPTRPIVRFATPQLSPEKSALAEGILDAEDALSSVHRLFFTPAERPAAHPAERVDEASIRVQHLEAALRGVPWFDVSNRRRATRAAEAKVRTDIETARRVAEEAVRLEERRIDEWWNALCANDPDVVTEHVNGVFATDASHQAKALGASGDSLEVAVLAPGEHVLPNEEVRLMPDGSLSIRRASSEHRAQLYRQHIAGIVIATARRALAASPGAGCARVHVLRSTRNGPFDEVSLLAVADLTREDLKRADFALDAMTLLLRTGRGVRLGGAGESVAMEPLPIDTVPGLAERLEQVCDGSRRRSA